MNKHDQDNNNQQRTHIKKSKKDIGKAAKPNIKVPDLKPSKDAKGGVTPGPIIITKPIDKGS